MVGADAVEDEAVDEQHAAGGHGHGNSLVDNTGIDDPGLLVDVVQVVDAGQQVGTGYELGAAVVEVGFFEVEDDGGQRLGPLGDVAVEAVGVLGSEVEGGVIVAVFDDFDIGAQDGFERVEDREAGGDLAEDGVIASHDLGEAHGGAVGAADDGLDFVFEVGPDSGFEVFYGFSGERVRQFEETVVAEKADLFWR